MKPETVSLDHHLRIQVPALKGLPETISFMCIHHREIIPAKYKAKHEPLYTPKEALLFRKRNKKSVKERAQQPVKPYVNDRYGIESFVFLMGSVAIGLVNGFLFPFINLLTIFAALRLVAGFIAFVKSGREKKRLGKVFYNKAFSAIAACILIIYTAVAGALICLFILFWFIGF